MLIKIASFSHLVKSVKFFVLKLLFIFFQCTNVFFYLQTLSQLTFRNTILEKPKFTIIGLWAGMVINHSTRKIGN